MPVAQDVATSLPVPELLLGIAGLSLLTLLATWLLRRRSSPAGTSRPRDEKLAAAAERLDPHGLNTELAMAEAALLSRGTTGDLERVLRSMLNNGQAGDAITVVRRVFEQLPIERLTTGFAWDMSTRFAVLKPRRDAAIEEGLLWHAAHDPGLTGVRASLRLAEMGTTGEVQLERAQDALRAAMVRPEMQQFRARCLELADMLELAPSVTASLKQPVVPALSVATAPAKARPMPPELSPAPAVVETTVASLSPNGLHLERQGVVRVLPFTRIRAVQTSIVGTPGNGLLVVDILMRGNATPTVFRLTSRDAGVPALFPQLSPTVAWSAFLEQLERMTSARFLPPVATLRAGKLGVVPSLDVLEAPRPSTPSPN